jgi:hypothetical protein
VCRCTAPSNPDGCGADDVLIDVVVGVSEHHPYARQLPPGNLRMCRLAFVGHVRFLRGETRRRGSGRSCDDSRRMRRVSSQVRTTGVWRRWTGLRPRTHHPSSACSYPPAERRMRATVRVKCLFGAPRGRHRCRSDEMICALGALAERVPSGQYERSRQQARAAESWRRERRQLERRSGSGTARKGRSAASRRRRRSCYSACDASGAHAAGGDGAAG